MLNLWYNDGLERHFDFDNHKKMHIDSMATPIGRVVFELFIIFEFFELFDLNQRNLIQIIPNLLNFLNYLHIC